MQNSRPHSNSWLGFGVSTTLQCTHSMSYPDFLWRHSFIDKDTELFNTTVPFQSELVYSISTGRLPFVPACLTRKTCADTSHFNTLHHIDAATDAQLSPALSGVLRRSKEACCFIPLPNHTSQDVLLLHAVEHPVNHPHKPAQTSTVSSQISRMRACCSVQTLVQPCAGLNHGRCYP